MKKINVLLVIAILCSSLVSSISSVKATSSINNNYTENIQIEDNVLLNAGFTQDEINIMTTQDKEIIYKALMERSRKSEFVRKLIHALHHVGGGLRDFVRKIGIRNIVLSAIQIWEACDGEPKRIIYHVLRHFGASRNDANRWSKIIIDMIGYL